MTHSTQDPAKDDSSLSDRLTATAIPLEPSGGSPFTPLPAEQPPVGKSFVFAFALAYAGFWIACLMPGTELSSFAGSCVECVMS